jgi:hypothetical protein
VQLRKQIAVMSLVRVSLGETRQVGLLLARSFHREPLMVEMLPDDAVRERPRRLRARGSGAARDVASHAPPAR